MTTFSPKDPTTIDPSAISELDRLRLALKVDGAIVYDWYLGEDKINWDDNFGAVLNVSDVTMFRTGEGFRTFLDPEGASLRDNLRNNCSPNFSSFHLEYQFRSLDSEICWLEDRGQRLFDENNNPTRVIGVIRVITDRKMHESKINYLASYDDLTGHLNRSKLREHLDYVLSNVKKNEVSASYLLAGIDDLAIVNSDYGFDVADEVIIGVGERLSSFLGKGDEIGRTAGNKFGIVLNGCSGEETVERSKEMVELVRASAIETTAGPIPVSISIGCVSLTAEDEDSQRTMIKAEEALDKAKRMGRSKVESFLKSEKVESVRKRNALVADQVVSALNDRRIVIAYQPIVSAMDCSVNKYECLIRMIDTEGELVAAGDFVPIAEELGLIRLLDRRVLELAVDTLHARPDVHLAVNVSGMTATEAICLDGYIDLLSANRTVTNRLTVELTETSAIRDMEESERFLSRLHELDCQVAIDDFGAGYTSFRNLQALVVDCVKIDGAFIRELESSQDNQLFVRTLVDLAKNFGLETVAEWVGSQKDAELLRDYGVDYLQGFYIGKPELELPAPAAGQASSSHQKIA